MSGTIGCQSWKSVRSDICTSTDHNAVIPYVHWEVVHDVFASHPGFARLNTPGLVKFKLAQHSRSYKNPCSFNWKTGPSSLFPLSPAPANIDSRSFSSDFSPNHVCLELIKGCCANYVVTSAGSKCHNGAGQRGDSITKWAWTISNMYTKIRSGDDFIAKKSTYNRVHHNSVCLQCVRPDFAHHVHSFSILITHPVASCPCPTTELHSTKRKTVACSPDTSYIIHNPW